MSFIEINGQRIGPGHPVYIIAEVGSNHNKDLSTVVEMIDRAEQAGVDAIKFQTFYPDDFISQHIKTQMYDLANLYTEELWQEVLHNHLILPFEWYDELIPYVRKRDLHFITTVHSDRSLAFALEYDPDAIKIASMDLTNTALLASAAKSGKPLIVSIGMGLWADIEKAVQVLEFKNSNFVFLHCVSTYPARYETLNLRFIKTLQRAFLRPVGFSDHSLGTTSAIVAVALGASVIEKHFTLDRNLKGPDHHFALEPSELMGLVEEIRKAEASQGSSRRILSDSEKHNASLYRRSVVANGDLCAGKILKECDLKLQRPGYGVQPCELEIIVGRVLKKDLQDGEVITWDLLS